MQLTEEERQWLSGSGGPAVQMAMRILTQMGALLGADRLIPIESAHVDGCLYHGPTGLAFAERLVQGGGRVAVPTTLNVGAMDLLRPHLVRLQTPERERAIRLMKAYEALGCQSTWTCAPYQAGHRPRAGTDVAWAESNAVVFANSVLGARTNRYGDFIDICAALTARAPRYGLHLEALRRATVLVRTEAIADELKSRDVFYPVLGVWLGRCVGSEVAAIADLPHAVTEDQLKALGAAAASSGCVGLFHVIGVTPEARTLAQAFAGEEPARTIALTPQALLAARDTMSTTASEALDAVALGSPHFSKTEMQRFLALLGNRRTRAPVYICTGRHVAAALHAAGQVEGLAAQGVEIVVDTCVVVTPILRGRHGVVMTNSGKFAHYTPSNTGYDSVYGSLEECVESAVAGRVVRCESIWS